jgi:uncharacterized protein YabN with tetrapyrrole methylase and pyrophosphatase domain
MEKNMQKTALEKLIATDKELRDFGFQWPGLDMILWQISSELAEVKEVVEQDTGKDHLQEEIGDLLHSVISLCLFTGLDIDETIEKATDKLQSRTSGLKGVAKQKGHASLKGQDSEYMLKLWYEAKRNCQNE